MRKELNKYANKCERLSREYTKLRDTQCRCGCGKRVGLDWSHAITREREEFKYHPDNTFRLNHECHLRIDHGGKKDEFFSKLIGEERYSEMKQKAFRPFKPTKEWYEQQIQQLQQLIEAIR